MGIFLLILLVVLLFWPWITGWLSRKFSGYMSHRYEDMFRRMMGMPTRKEERASKRRKTSSGEGQSASPRHADTASRMKAVAEDVEFTEIREFESTTVSEDDGSTRFTYHEEQVSDAEYVEIKERNPRGDSNKRKNA